MRRHSALVLLVAACAALSVLADDETPKLSDERVVFQTKYGDFEFAFYPEVAPVTSAHIFKLVRMGLYNSNHIFRVDKGFVAQTADVLGNVLFDMNADQRAEAQKTVPLEVKQGVKHHEGVVSMARGNDRNSGSSSFFICYGDAPHLDMQYGAFGKVTKGMETLHKLESLPTKREGIFVMPLERITITNTYWYKINRPEQPLTLPGATGSCDDQLADLQLRFESQADELQRVRKKCLPA